MKAEEILNLIIRPALERADEEMPNFQLKNIQPATPLYGVPDALLDSLNLITFVFIVEEEFQRVTTKSLKITTQDVLNQVQPPFASLTSLALFLEGKL